MFKLEKKSFSDDSVLTGEIQRLIFGRLAFIFLLLIAGWWWTSSYLQIPDKIFPDELFFLFLYSIGLTIVYLFFLHLKQHLHWQIRVQFLMDILLTTWIVWQTGDIVSPYVTLYIILTSVVGYFFGKTETIFTAVLCAVCYSVLSVLSAQSFIYSFSGDVPSSRFLQIIAFNNVALLIVGLLAARVSERRRLKEQLRETVANFADFHILHERIVESIKSGLITTDLEGKIYSFNHAAEDIFGLQASETIGQSIFSVFGESIRARVDVCLGSVQSDEFTTEHFETEIPAVGGGKRKSQVTVACSITPLVGRTSKVTGLILTFQDISQMRAMEETLRRSDRLAAVGRMAAGLAHEIRNPLGSMSAALQFLQTKLPPSTTEASLMEVVLSESDRLNHIITNFLTYARPSANIFSKESFLDTDISQTIRDCLTLLRHSPEVKTTHLIEFAPPKKQINIQVNQTQIKQVFWNILRNSLEAMPTGGTLNVRVKELRGKNIQIIFEDTGIGISPENLEHLFEPFSVGANGTGLGLSIAHKIIVDHGGRINVQSRENSGTKITVQLPR